MKYDPPWIYGWMGTWELEWLFERAQEMDSIVEVGSWEGRSSHALLSGCRGPVYCVDHFKGSPSEMEGFHKKALTEDIYELFMKNVGYFPNLHVLKMDSVEASEQFEPKSVDMVFIDADHTLDSVIRDVSAWLPKCKKLICGHDLFFMDVREALKTLNVKFENPLAELWSVWI